MGDRHHSIAYNDFQRYKHICNQRHHQRKRNCNLSDDERYQSQTTTYLRHRK